jgi:hypothetical protein
MKIKFEDVDLTENGLYLNKDTMLTNVGGQALLEINLEEK